MAANAGAPVSGATQSPKCSDHTLLSLTSEVHSAVNRLGSRMRSPYSDMIVDFFRAPEQEIRSAAIDFIASASSLVSSTDLDLWERRPSGVLVVGSSKALIARLLRGDNIKDQAAGAIRTITGNLTYLNLAQLVVLKQNCQLHIDGGAPRPELRDFSNCLDEALNEKLVTTLLNKSELYYQVDSAAGVEVETFSHAERKFLGRRLILHIGALHSRQSQGRTFSFNVHDSDWFIFCGVKAPDTEEEVRGLYVVYPALQVHLRRQPDTPIYCLAELRDSDGSLNRATATGQVSWHLLAAPPSMSLDELVRASLSFKTSMVAQYPKGNSRFKKGMSYEGTPVVKEEEDDEELEEEPATPDTEVPETGVQDSIELEKVEGVETKESETDAPEAEAATEEQPEGGEGGEGGEEQGEEEWYMQGPVEYDEAVPTYYDVYQEMYFYYGNMLFYDADSEWYYYFDWDQQGYVYIDEQTQNAINEGTLPVWNQEDGQYYDPSGWAEEAAGNEDEKGDEGTTAEENATEAAQIDGIEAPEEASGTEVIADETVEEEVAAEDTSIQEVEQKITESTTLEVEPEDQVVPEIPQEAEAESPAPLISKQSDVSCNEGGDTLEEGAALRAPQASSTRVFAQTPAPAPPTAPEKFSGSIDQFQASQGMLINCALKEIVSLFDDHLEVLTRYEKRPNGMLCVGRSKRTIDALIKGTMELKALTPTDCADIATSLSYLHLAQLLYIRRNAQNSAWDKSPLSTLKNFAMKTDSLIGEKFFLLLLQRGAIADEMDKLGVGERETPAAALLQQLSIVECRQSGSVAIFVMGAMSELKQSKCQILGDEFAAGRTPKPQSSWWWLPCTPTGAAAAPRGEVENNPKGVFFQYPELRAQFSRPAGLDLVYKLVAGRQAAGFLTWDVLQIHL